jgi:hypothetical protein
MKESLTDIDVYITIKMAEAKQVALSPCLNESIYLNCKRQVMLMSSIGVQIMQSGVPAGTGIGSAKSAMIFSNNVDPPQATVAKMEQIGDDHVEGNTILQLDQMRRIQPTGGTADLAPLTTGDTTSNKTEDVHPQEDPLDITMTEVNLQDIISTPAEDAMIDIMNTSAEDATLEDTSDSEVKNDYVPIETVEVQETVGSVDQIYKKVTAELQEFAGAPLINGKVDEVIVVFVYNHMVEITHMNFGNCRSRNSVQTFSPSRIRKDFGYIIK